DDHDVIHDNNSSDLALSTSLYDLDFATLNIDGQSMNVETPPYITDVEEDDDFIDDEDDVPRDLADSDDEVLANDDDGAMSIVVARGHSGDGGGDDPSRPLHIRLAPAEKPPWDTREAAKMDEARGPAKKLGTLGLRKLRINMAR
ncbi:hypothetical protein Tco_0644548, partial [Tanacetum coccineum]